VDEEGTLERLKADRREFFDPKIGEYSSPIVKTTDNMPRRRTAVMAYRRDRPF
jgi:hypothetical protein